MIIRHYEYDTFVQILVGAKLQRTRGPQLPCHSKKREGWDTVWLFNRRQEDSKFRDRVQSTDFK
ncbi:hypothetical protein T265_15726, partial [Opisthorchis viverrini]